MDFMFAESDVAAAPGMWFILPLSRLDLVKHEKHGHVAVVCPVCHSALTLSGRVHSVSEVGAVSPSFVCTRAGCSFHDFIVLEGW